MHLRGTWIVSEGQYPHSMTGEVEGLEPDDFVRLADTEWFGRLERPEDEAWWSPSSETLRISISDHDTVTGQRGFSLADIPFRQLCVLATGGPCYVDRETVPPRWSIDVPATMTSAVLYPTLGTQSQFTFRGASDKLRISVTAEGSGPDKPCRVVIANTPARRVSVKLARLDLIYESPHVSSNRVDDLTCDTATVQIQGSNVSSLIVRVNPPGVSGGSIL